MSHLSGCVADSAAVRAAMQPLGDRLRRCTGECGRLLPLRAFGRNKRGPFGLSWHCKRCLASEARRTYARRSMDRFCEAAEQATAAASRGSLSGWFRRCFGGSAHRLEEAIVSAYGAGVHLGDAGRVVRAIVNLRQAAEIAERLARPAVPSDPREVCRLMAEAYSPDERRELIAILGAGLD